MALRANLDCQIVEISDTTDDYGQLQELAARDARCAPVKLIFASKKTSVRTDSSGTRGNAREIETNVILLFPGLYPIAIGNFVLILGHKVRVASAEPKYRVDGVLDHVRVVCEAWD